MFGTLRGALAGRKIAFDRDSFTAAAEGRIVGHGKTIRIRSIHLHYDLSVPADALEATERALAAHPEGCPAHQSVKGAIEVTWDASGRERAGHDVVADAANFQTHRARIEVDRAVRGGLIRPPDLVDRPRGCQQRDRRVEPEREPRQ